MQKSDLFKFVLFALILFCAGNAFPCSMYKITAGGKTMVGNNEDSWRLTSSIWFEQGTGGRFGVAYVGYSDKPHPDGAMNEHGLAFDAFTMLRKTGIPARDPGKNDFSYVQLKTIMQQCKTVEEVHAFLEKLNLQPLNGSQLFHGAMLLFVDRTGNYLVVETDKMTFGADSTFVLANFSFADTRDLGTVKMERYCKGVAFLGNKKPDTGLPFCAALSDTMSVHRKKAGDGTLYTTIYDLEERIIYTYFFHDFDTCAVFRLDRELEKGGHAYSFAGLFPDNTGYREFLSYKTPRNNRRMLLLLAFCGMLFFSSSVFFVIRFFRRPEVRYRYVQPALAILGAALCSYMYVLVTNEPVFYFPSPYLDDPSWLVSLTAYLPFVLLIAIIPLLVFLARVIREKSWNKLATGLLATNSLAYCALIGLFAYWGLLGG